MKANSVELARMMASANNMGISGETSTIDMDMLEKWKQITAVDIYDDDFYPDYVQPKQNWLTNFQDTVSGFVASHKWIGSVFMILCILGYFVYFGFAISYDSGEATALIIITSLTIAWLIYSQIRDRFGDSIWTNVRPAWLTIKRWWPNMRWLVLPGLVIGVVVYTVSIITSWRQLRSLLGMVLFLLIPLLTCKHPLQIRWRPVIWGMALQFILGIAVLRWKPGFDAVNFISKEINRFLSYSLKGASLAFGDPMFLLHPFFMAVVPLVIYIGAVTGVLYHLGITQAFVSKMGFLMRMTLGTTGIESVSLGLNIFLSVAETILILKPYIPKLTTSEFHCLLVGSHATIAGFAYALFVIFGVDPQHLLTAAVMSAPAAVAISKLNYPETENSFFKTEEDCQMDRGTDSNVVEAMSNGAWQAGKTVSAILVQVIAFMSIYELLDVTLAYLGARIGIELSFQIIFSYLFRPLAYLIGVDWEESETVASILGLKLGANEVLAYLDLGRLRTQDLLSDKASALTTYAICGFSSFGTLAIFVGAWSTVDPKRVSQVSQMVPRIYMNTNLACFITACVAGILYDEEYIKSISPDTSNPLGITISAVFGLLPSYKSLLKLVGL